MYRGHVDLLLFGAVARRPLHGYAIVDAVTGAARGERLHAPTG